MAASSSAPVYLNGILWRSISLKYSLASFDVLVPKPRDEENNEYRLTVKKHTVNTNYLIISYMYFYTFYYIFIHNTHGNKKYM